jgi:serine/threonine-protein kinase HipA
LVEFGLKYCALEEKTAIEIFNNCQQALAESIYDIKSYIKQNKNFQEIGNRIIKEW